MEHSRNGDRSRRVEVCDSTSELTISSLLIEDMVLHILCLRLDPISWQIRNTIDERVGGRAMVAFVVVLNDTFPVRVQFHFPVMVKFKLPREIKVLHSGLFVDILIFIFPFYIRISSLQIDPNKPGFVDVDVDWK